MILFNVLLGENEEVRISPFGVPIRTLLNNHENCAHTVPRLRSTSQDIKVLGGAL